MELANIYFVLASEKEKLTFTIVNHGRLFEYFIAGRRPFDRQLVIAAHTAVTVAALAEVDTRIAISQQ